jgi:ribonucleoside-diphosphate reductase alpha chain
MKISLSPNARVVLEKRYLAKDALGNIAETPEELFTRVAKSVAAADAFFPPQTDLGRTEADFLSLLTEMRFLPNSPTLMNAGRDLGQLAACFVLPIEDSMESIFDSLKHTAMIHKSGGGTGFSFSRIRPAKDSVSSTAGVSSGPIPFMSVFDAATETVKQGGTRRGANMGVLVVDHPDIEAFITAKNDLASLSNFNISVALTGRFMEALERGEEYELINPRNRKPVARAAARKIFDMIIDSAWKTGEPGVVFIDRINLANPTPRLGRIEATNPCGEQPLLPYESCTLGSINLSRMVTGGRLDAELLARTVRSAVHFLDNIITVNRYPLPAIEKMSRETRKIGIGVMGFADMLIRLEIPFDSEAAVREAETAMSLIQRESRAASAALAETRGNFPAYPGSVFDRPDTPFMRNATTTTIAPTGTISLLAGVSSGIEPIFAVAHARNVLDGSILPEIHPLFIARAKEEGFFDERLIREILRDGSVQRREAVPEEMKKLFKTSHEIPVEWHVRIQAAFQKYTDNAVSKTINFPPEATREEVESAYRLAYDAGCKGVTIYRYGSRARQVLSIGGEREESVEVVPRPRPPRTHGFTDRIQTGCGKLYVTINSDSKGVCEVFAKMGKTGGCASSQIEAAGRLISLALRSGVKGDAIIKQLIGIRCPSPAWQNGKIVLSCPDAMAQILKRVSESEIVESETMSGVCPDCSGIMRPEGGCFVCRACGFSRC